MKKLFIFAFLALCILIAAGVLCSCAILNNRETVTDPADSGSERGDDSLPTVIDSDGSTDGTTRSSDDPDIHTTSDHDVDPSVTTTERPATNPPATEPPIVTTVITTVKITEPEAVEVEFKADLSDYEQYMNPLGDDWSDAYLVLLNAEHPMPKDFENTSEYKLLNSRVKVGSTGIFTYSPSLYFNEVAFQAFTAMTIEAHEHGIDKIDFTSAYRTYAKQDSIFSSNVSKTYKYECTECGHTYITKASYKKCELCGSSVVKADITYEEAAAQVATYSCAPGTSDHQSGLAVDVVQTSLPSRFNSLIHEFGETECGIWLAEHCWDFGFILRFPADKEDITGIIYEPWHFRFVGRYHALKMKELNMCLEEYLIYLTDNGYFDKDGSAASTDNVQALPEDSKKYLR